MAGVPQNYGVGQGNAITFGATPGTNGLPNLDFSQQEGNAFTLTLTGNITAWANWLNPIPGMKIDLDVYQDATGSRTITWPTNVYWAGGTAPTLTTTALAFDYLRFTYRASIGAWLGETVGKAYAA